MINLRTIATIFPGGYANAPDEEELRKKCLRQLHHFQLNEDVTEWLETIRCPYMREAVGGALLAVVKEKCRTGESSLNAIQRRELEEEILKEIQRAQADQETEQMLTTKTTSRPISEATITTPQPFVLTPPAPVINASPTYNFYGEKVVFNDIHDNNNLKIN